MEDLTLQLKEFFDNNNIDVYGIYIDTIDNKTCYFVQIEKDQESKVSEELLSEAPLEYLRTKDNNNILEFVFA